jgi:hypothetical protein
MKEVTGMNAMPMLSAPGPSPGDSQQSQWQSHFDKLARQRVQTPDQLAVRRESLITITTTYLRVVELANEAKAKPKLRSKQSKSRVQPTSSLIARHRAELIKLWGADEPWLRKTLELVEVFGKAPNKYELIRYLGFPPREDVHITYRDRKGLRALR